MHFELSDSSVIVVRGGGHGHRRSDSLRSGASVYHALRKKHNIHDLHIHADGTPMNNGKRVSMQKVLGSPATIFNCLHEDAAGTLAKVSNQYKTRHTGNSHVHRARHHHTRPQGKHFRKHGIPTLTHWTLYKEDAVANKKMNDAIAKQLNFPVVVYRLPKNFSRRQLVAEDRSELNEILQEVFVRQDRVFVQPAVSGRIFSAIVMPEFRSDSPYAFPKAQLRHNTEIANHVTEDRSYDHPQSRYDRFFHQFVRKAYRKADLYDLARIDVLERPDGKLTLFYIEAHPRLDRHSLLAESADKVGALLQDVFEKQVKLARKRSL